MPGVLWAQDLEGSLCSLSLTKVQVQISYSVSTDSNHQFVYIFGGMEIEVDQL